MGPITDYQAKYYAHELSIQHAAGSVDRLSKSLFDASVDLNPHQINAALFAINNPLSQGVVLADEVGLGKTIEAGLVLSQYWAERKRRLIIICPASLRRQWGQELQDKFNLPFHILDAKTWRTLQREGNYNPLTIKGVVIISYHYAARLEEQLMLEPWDLVVMDEAHKLRNAHRSSNKMGQSLKRALTGRKKLLLTATPLQNSLMELYGLSSIIDEHLFGDERAFRQQYIQTDRSLPELQNRLKGFVQRTLRKDVLEYVRYTQRRTITVPFSPTAQEQDLYTCITALLEKDESYALPKRQRHLTGLILRKLLASSTCAVRYTLETIKNRLQALQTGQVDDEEFLAQFVAEETLEQSYLEESPNECLDQNPSQNERTIDQTSLAEEIAEIEHYIQKAHAISIDSKAKALLIAIRQGFEQMEAMGAPRKVIIFTESRRTQAYLAEFLAANGYAESIVTFSGTNNQPAVTAIYQQWKQANEGGDQITGSPQVDRRTALIDHFKHHAEIMIATEAAAEGVNLQFCATIINYDLPWNPQRVEQRIGRCHRYGQKFDVVVINFINQSNQADQRVLELLGEKFHLFDGVFGASDDVLGSIESGLDFEKRIQQIYDTCRTADEINSAFDALQKEFEDDIDKKMQQTRQLLLENFDEDIHDLLKMQLNAAEQRLDRVGRWFWALTQHQLKAHASFDSSSPAEDHRFQLKQSINNMPQGTYQLIQRGISHSAEKSPLAHAHTYRLNHPLGEWVIQQAIDKQLPSAHVEFDYSAHHAKITVIEALQGKAGTLVLQRYAIESLERSEEYLIFAAQTDAGEIIPAEVAQKMMQLPAQTRSTETVTASEKLQAMLEETRNNISKSVNERNLSYFEQEVNKLDDWADDIKEGLEYSIKELDKEIRQVRREAKVSPTLDEKLAKQKQQRKLESLRNKQRRDLFDKQDEVDERREALIETLEGKLNKKTDMEKLFVIRWSVK